MAGSITRDVSRPIKAIIAICLIFSSYREWFAIRKLLTWICHEDCRAKEIDPSEPRVAASPTP
jgi:hypothetical protein